jgi:hypothetical protein
MPVQQRLRDRSTADLAVLALVGLVIVVVLAAVLTVAVIEIKTDGEGDTQRVVDLIANILKVLIGAIVGYIAGRNLNGNHKQSPPTNDETTPR